MAMNQQLSYKVFPSSLIPRVCEKNDFNEWIVKEKYYSVVGQKPIWINDTYIPFLYHPAKYKIYKGGSGSGKSDFIATELLLKVITQKFCRVLYIRHEFSTLRISVFQLFKDIIERNNWGKDFVCMESTLKIIHKPSGNFLIGAGLDDVEKLKSVTDITDCWIEEAITRYQKLTEAQFNELDRRVRTQRASLHFYISFNPVDKDNFIYEAFGPKPTFTPYDSTLAPRSSFLMHTSCYTDNFFISEDEVLKMERLKLVNYQEWCVYGRGDWGNPKTGNEYVYNFSSLKHVKHNPINPERHFEFGIDLNVNPYITGLVAQLEYDYENKQLVIKLLDELCLKTPKNTIPALCDEFAKRFLVPCRQTMNWIADASSKNRIAGFGDAKDKIPYWEIKKRLKKYSYFHSDKCGMMKKNPSRLIARDTINFILAELAPDGISKSKYRIEIDPKCVNLITDLSDLQCGPDGYDPERTKDDNDNTYEKLGHCYSSLVYLIYYICQEYFTNRKLRTPNDTSKK